MYLLITSILGLKEQSHQSSSKSERFWELRCCEDLNVGKEKLLTFC
jgi:hypothetical protein